MQQWYENRKLLNTLIVLTCAGFVAYFFFQQHWGLPLFLGSGTAVMVRGITKITMQMRNRKRGTDEKTNLHQIKRD